MSFYLDRLEAARRRQQQRMTAEAEGAAAGCAPPPAPRAWPYFRYYQHAAALLPRSPTLPVPPLHGNGEGGGGSSGVGQARGTWRRGGSVAVARSEAAPVSVGAGGLAGDGAVRGVAGSVAPAPAREEEEAGGVGGGEMRSKKKCLLAPAPDEPCPPPKRRAVPARRRFPPGCGRDAAAAAAARLVGTTDDGDSCSEPARRGGGGSGALQESTTTTPHAAASATAAAPCSSALNKASAADGAAGATTDGARHSPWAALEKPSEAPGKNSVAAADALCNASQGGVAGRAGSGDQSSKSKDNFVPSVRLLPKPSMVSAYRRFPPGCQRRVAPLLAGGGSSQQVSSPPSSEAVRPVPQDRDELETVAPLCSGTSDGPAQSEESELEEGEVASEVLRQECPSATLHDEDTPCRHGASSSEEMTGNTWPCEENRSGGSGDSCNVVAESLAQGRAAGQEHLNGESVSECASMDTASSGVAAAVSAEEGAIAMTRKKVMFTPRKSVKPPKLIQKPALNTQRMPFSKETEEETELGRHTTNGIEDDTDEFMKDGDVQDPMSADKCPWSWTKGKNQAATVSGYFGPKKKKENANLEDHAKENKCGGSPCNVVAESLAGLAKEHLGSESVSECATTDTGSSGAAAAGVSDEGAMMRKIMCTPRKSVKPPKLIQKPSLKTDEFATKGKDAATVSDYYFGPKKKKKKKVNAKEDSSLLDDDILKAIAVHHEGKFEDGPLQNADARSKVKMLCSRFESICRAIVQSAEQRSLKVRRIDLAADKLMRKLPGFTKPGPIVGPVPGVEVGDEFLYRVQLALVGLHRPYQGGIDTTRDARGVPVAISVVASGGYPDELSCPGELIYTGSGKDGADQKLEHGNLALRNCVEGKVPVRVIHGFKGLNREGGKGRGSHSRAKEITTFTYDGMYRVVDCWKEGSPGSKVFKFKLQRIPGQPGLPLHVAKFVRKNNTT